MKFQGKIYPRAIYALALCVLVAGFALGGIVHANMAFAMEDFEQEGQQNQSRREGTDKAIDPEVFQPDYRESERDNSYREAMRPEPKERAVLDSSLQSLQPPRRWTYTDVDVIARMVWGEGRGVSRNEQKLIVWTVINRLEHGGYGSSLVRVVRAPGQFHGYSSNFPINTAIREMTIEVLEAWDRGDSAKVYPPFARVDNYRYFWGDGRHNWFRTNWR